jgi:tRNA U55 pseudouridine synthase TruB
LERTACEEYFTLDNAVTLDQIEKLNKDELEDLFVDPKTLLPSFHVVNDSTGELSKDIRHGRSVRISIESVASVGTNCESTDTLITDQNNRLIAIGNLEFSQDSQCIFKPSKVLI